MMVRIEPSEDDRPSHAGELVNDDIARYCNMALLSDGVCRMPKTQLNQSLEFYRRILGYRCEWWILTLNKGKKSLEELDGGC